MTTKTPDEEAMAQAGLERRPPLRLVPPVPGTSTPMDVAIKSTNAINALMPRVNVMDDDLVLTKAHVMVAASESKQTKGMVAEMKRMLERVVGSLERIERRMSRIEKRLAPGGEVEQRVDQRAQMASRPAIEELGAQLAEKVKEAAHDGAAEAIEDTGKHLAVAPEIVERVLDERELEEHRKSKQTAAERKAERRRDIRVAVYTLVGLIVAAIAGAFINHYVEAALRPPAPAVAPAASAH